MKYWYLILPCILVLLENCFQQIPRSFLHFSDIAQRDIPGLLIQTYVETYLRTVMYYALVTTGWELCLGAVAKRPIRIFSFLVAYPLLVKVLSYEYPALGTGYVASWRPYMQGLFLLSLVGWVGSRWIKGTKRWQPFFAGSSFVVFATLLWGTGVNRWSGELRSASESNSPSIVWLSLDGVPGRFFEERNRNFTPLWNSRWRERALHFTNAYSVVNGTYASFISMLSGQPPQETQIRSLFPSDRLGAVELKTLLPRQLEQRGYRTVYMTDCEATSWMPESFGFQQRYQGSAGVLACGRTLWMSYHPLLALFQPGEINNFCSALYHPQSFFDAIGKKIEELSKNKAPFFLVAHSCTTHQSLIHHLPSRSEPQYYEPFQKEELPLRSFGPTLREADFLMDSLLERLADKKIWTFLFSDHGVRPWKVNGVVRHLIHAWELPLSRDQYHVPLAILSPEITPGIRDSLVTLPQLYEATLSIADERPHLPAPQPFAILSSTVPFEGGEPAFRALAYSQSSFDTKGEFSFSQKLEQELFRREPLALVALPYRLIVDRSGGVKLFHELADPENEQDLAGRLPAVRQRLSKILELNRKNDPRFNAAHKTQIFFSWSDSKKNL